MPWQPEVGPVGNPKGGGWPPGPKSPPLPLREIHVWWLSWAAWPWHPEGDWALLSAEDRERVLRMRSSEAREQFVRSRSALRRLVGLYLGERPRSVRFATGSHGKPEVADPRDPPLRYNLSHVSGHLLLAFSCASAVGVDLDRLDRRVDHEALARRILSPVEVEGVEGLPQEDRPAALLRLWIRKEAYTKARGLGFKYGFRNVGLSPAASPPGPILVEDAADPQAPARWWIRDLSLPPPLAGALSAEAPVVPLRCWTVTPPGNPQS